MDSHIQLPNFILKHFRNDSGKVFYLDINKKSIGLSGTKNIGTKEDYYSAPIEKFLNKEIETPFGNIVDRVLKFIGKKTGKKLVLNNAEVILKKYITALLTRSNLSLNSFFEHSQTARFFSMQENHDGLIFFATKNNDGIMPYIETYNMGLLVNYSNKNFVIPQNGLFTSLSTKMHCIVIPISPNVAFMLLPNEYPIQKKAKCEIPLFYIDKDDDVNLLNIRALYYEYIFNKDFNELKRTSFLVSKTKEELDSLLEHLEANVNLLKINAQKINDKK